MDFKITYILLLISAIMTFKGLSDQIFFNKFAFKPFDAIKHREFYRFGTGALLHGDWMHFLFNAIAIGSFGLNIEAAIGPIYFLILVLSSMIGSEIYPVIRHRLNPNYTSVGLSGVGASIIFCAVMWFPNTELLFFFIPMKAYIFGPVYLILEFYQNKQRKGNIAHDAHISGAIFGILFALFVNNEQVILAYSAIFR